MTTGGQGGRSAGQGDAAAGGQAGRATGQGGGGASDAGARSDGSPPPTAAPTRKGSSIPVCCSTPPTSLA